MRRALVAGGVDFIVSRLVDLLLDEGWQLTVVNDFNPFYDLQLKRQNFAPYLAHLSYTLVEAINGLGTFRKRLFGEYPAAKAGVLAFFFRSSLLRGRCSGNFESL